MVWFLVNGLKEKKRQNFKVNFSLSFINTDKVSRQNIK